MDGYDKVIEQIKQHYHISCGNYLVHIMYKYNHETEYTNEYQYMEYSDDYVCWFNDWWEGQQDIICLGILNLDELPPTMFHYITPRKDEKK